MKVNNEKEAPTVKEDTTEVRRSGTSFLAKRFGVYDKIKLPVIVLDIIIIVASVLLVLAFIFGR
jgi:hypothetical protein